MLKPFLFALALALGLSPLPAAAQQTQAATLAQSLTSLIGEKFDGGIFISNITSEDNTLVIAVDGTAGWRADMSPEVVSDALLSGFCQQGAGLFTNGLTMRVDSTDSGKLLKGPLISACPAKPAQ